MTSANALCHRFRIHLTAETVASYIRLMADSYMYVCMHCVLKATQRKCDLTPSVWSCHVKSHADT